MISVDDVKDKSDIKVSFRISDHCINDSQKEVDLINKYGIVFQEIDSKIEKGILKKTGFLRYNPSKFSRQSSPYLIVECEAFRTIQKPINISTFFNKSLFSKILDDRYYDIKLTPISFKITPKEKGIQFKINYQSENPFQSVSNMEIFYDSFNKPLAVRIEHEGNVDWVPYDKKFREQIKNLRDQKLQNLVNSFVQFINVSSFDTYFERYMENKSNTYYDFFESVFIKRFEELSSFEFYLFATIPLSVIHQNCESIRKHYPEYPSYDSILIELMKQMEQKDIETQDISKNQVYFIRGKYQCELKQELWDTDITNRSMLTKMNGFEPSWGKASKIFDLGSFLSNFVVSSKNMLYLNQYACLNPYPTESFISNNLRNCYGFLLAIKKTGTPFHSCYESYINEFSFCIDALKKLVLRLFLIQR